MYRYIVKHDTIYLEGDDIHFRQIRVEMMYASSSQPHAYEKLGFESGIIPLTTDYDLG